jgi:hypothetical protein
MNKCTICGKQSTLICSACKQSYYCSREHQVSDWPNHQIFCKMAKHQVQEQGVNSLIDDDKVFTKNESVGTFRWKTFQPAPLPLYPKIEGFPLGWKDYLEYRFSETKDKVEVEASMLDALSFPLTIIYFAKLLKLESMSSVVLIGCTSKAEERILLQSNFFGDIAHQTQIKNIYLVGNEVSKFYKITKDNLNVTIFKGPLSDFIKEYGIDINPKSTFIVGFNTGIACGKIKILEGWLPDIVMVLKCDYHLCLTSANDHTDLKNETILFQKVIDAQYCLQPIENPFSAPTRYYAPGMKDEWYTNASHIYAVKGFKTKAIWNKGTINQAKEKFMELIK